MPTRLSVNGKSTVQSQEFRADIGKADRFARHVLPPCKGPAAGPFYTVASTGAGGESATAPQASGPEDPARRFERLALRLLFPESQEGCGREQSQHTSAGRQGRTGLGAAAQSLMRRFQRLPPGNQCLLFGVQRRIGLPKGFDGLFIGRRHGGGKDRDILAELQDRVQVVTENVRPCIGQVLRVEQEIPVGHPFLSPAERAL